eukprot:2258941-Ditylum_brightwellii.AAC.1
MRTVPTSTKQSNPDTKQAVIPFPRPAPKQLKHGQFHAYKLHTTQQTTAEEWINFRCGLAAVLKGQKVTQDPASYMVAKTLLKGDVLA